MREENKKKPAQAAAKDPGQGQLPGDFDRINEKSAKAQKVRTVTCEE